MEKCKSKKDNSIEHNVTEHIFTIVNRVENDKIYVSINNHMFFEPYYNPNALLKDNIIVIKKENIKELKRYTEESYHNTIKQLNKIFMDLPLDKQLYLLNSNNFDKEIFFEQILNRYF